MHRERMELLKKLMAIEFAAIELNLFLDTHPDNREALQDYNDTVEEFKCLRDMYECKYGPLFNFGLSRSQGTWQWPDEPWPWQINWR